MLGSAQQPCLPHTAAVHSPVSRAAHRGRSARKISVCQLNPEILRALICAEAGSGSGDEQSTTPGATLPVRPGGAGNLPERLPHTQELSLPRPVLLPACESCINCVVPQIAAANNRVTGTIPTN